MRRGSSPARSEEVWSRETRSISTPPSATMQPASWRPRRQRKCTARSMALRRVNRFVCACSPARCAALPDPLTCFAGAVFEQRIAIDLDSTASLVLVDWLTSGRRARGERWAFRRYASRIDVRAAGKLVFRDAISLDASDGPIDGDHRMGRCDCFGTVLLMGGRMEAACEKLLVMGNAQPVHRGERLIFSASPVPGGVVLRVAGPETEVVGKWIRDRLRFVAGLLGGDPWARKW